MKPIGLEKLKKLPELNLAVVGHVEWMKFLAVDHLPKGGLISHSIQQMDQPAGGGALAAVEMMNLIKKPVHFFTALGKDESGEKSYEKLKNLGLNLSVAWRDEPTREGISFVDSQGERAITVIGKRLQPTAKDPLPWEDLQNFDGVFITAGDSEVITLCRKSNLLVATPRVGIQYLQESNVQIDLLVGSGLDPGEKYNPDQFSLKPKLRIATQGADGGIIWPGGKYEAVKLSSQIIDTYGCGDKFAAGVTTGLAAKWSIEEAISLGAHCGALCATYFGPY